MRKEALAYRTLDDGTPWHDDAPVIGVLYVLRHTARRSGYAVAVHGSMARDLDVIAVPWAVGAVTPAELVERILTAIGGTFTPGQENPIHKPHGRLAYAINLHPTGMYVDLSVIPPIAPSPESTGTQEVAT